MPLAVVGYHQTTGEWLDLTTLEGKEKASGGGDGGASVRVCTRREGFLAGKVDRYYVGRDSAGGIVVPFFSFSSSECEPGVGVGAGWCS